MSKMKTNKRYVLPIDEFLDLSQPYDVRHSDGPSIHARVDWDGGDNLGSFAVRNGDAWVECGNLSIHTSANDLILAPMNPKLRPGKLEIHMERGPLHAGVGFEAWAMSIEWDAEQAPRGVLPRTFTAERDKTYHYSNVGVYFWQRSSPDDKGVERLTLALEPSRYYELWVKLRHPTDPSRWTFQDPVAGDDDDGEGETDK
ncbi:hypothetical protein [Haliangium sp.]|uniref:hypothetical protein n=1 Tax=Haliangium sp. TaxID=2663208 RepID=UPI003D1447C3